MWFSLAGLAWLAWLGLASLFCRLCSYDSKLSVLFSSHSLVQLTLAFPDIAHTHTDARTAHAPTKTCTRTRACTHTIPTHDWRVRDGAFQGGHRFSTTTRRTPPTGATSLRTLRRPSWSARRRWGSAGPQFSGWPGEPAAARPPSPGGGRLPVAIGSRPEDGGGGGGYVVTILCLCFSSISVPPLFEGYMQALFLCLLFPSYMYLASKVETSRGAAQPLWRRTSGIACVAITPRHPKPPPDQTRYVWCRGLKPIC